MKSEVVLIFVSRQIWLSLTKIKPSTYASGIRHYGRCHISPVVVLTGSAYSLIYQELGTLTGKVKLVCFFFFNKLKRKKYSSIMNCYSVCTFVGLIFFDAHLSLLCFTRSFTFRINQHIFRNDRNTLSMRNAFEY